MTNPNTPIDYDAMLEEIIELIQKDDTLNSATIEGMVKRLRELNALGMGEFLTRQIIAGNGLTGGGDLSEDRTLALSDGVLDSLSKADAAINPTALADALEPYLKTAVGDTKYASKADAKQAWAVPFTHPGTVNAEISSPALRLPTNAVLTDITVTVGGPSAELTVKIDGGEQATVVLLAGELERVSSGLSVPVSQAVKITLNSTSAVSPVVLLRFREV